MLSGKRVRAYLHSFEHLARTRFGLKLYGQPIWAFRRKPVAGGLSLGVALAFVPLPIQSLLCVPLAIFLRVNLPAALAAVWLSNPITAAPIFFFAFRVGMLMTGSTGEGNRSLADLSVSDLGDLMENLWIPLFSGCLACALVSGLLTYVLVSFFWRIQVTYARKRK